VQRVGIGQDVTVADHRAAREVDSQVDGRVVRIGEGEIAGGSVVHGAGGDLPVGVAERDRWQPLGGGRGLCGAEMVLPAKRERVRGCRSCRRMRERSAVHRPAGAARRGRAHGSTHRGRFDRCGDTLHHGEVDRRPRASVGDGHGVQPDDHAVGADVAVCWVACRADAEIKLG
jgi:hypothetical protein